MGTDVTLILQMRPLSSKKATGQVQGHSLHKQQRQCQSNIKSAKPEGWKPNPRCSHLGSSPQRGALTTASEQVFWVMRLKALLGNAHLKGLVLWWPCSEVPECVWHLLHRIPHLKDESNSYHFIFRFYMLLKCSRASVFKNEVL